MAYAGVTCDSRKVRPGYLFVAVPGAKADGADFARDAVARGAVAVVSTHSIEGLGVPVMVKEDVRRFLGEEVARFRGNPSHDVRTWGVTGTNGKTTTTWILREFLGPRCGYVTTVETFTGLRRFASAHTTPDAESLQADLAEMRDAGLTDCAMEVSSHALEQNRTAGTRYAGGAFTNLTEDHLDYHGTMERYFAAKTLFFRRLAAENPGAPAAICVEGDYGRRLAEICRGLPLRTITCGFGADADVRARDFDLSACPLVGRYNALNVLTAAALAQGAGVPRAAIDEAIPRLTSRWGRLERVETRSLATVYVDFAHTDDALANVLATVRAATPGRTWAVFGAGGDRDRGKRPLMGAAAARHADALVVTSDNPRGEDPEAIIAEIFAGIPAGTDAVAEPDRRKAIYLALANAREGDSVVICGKGHETTQEIAGRFLPFDDRSVAAGFVVE